MCFDEIPFNHQWQACLKLQWTLQGINCHALWTIFLLTVLLKLYTVYYKYPKASVRLFLHMNITWCWSSLLHYAVLTLCSNLTICMQLQLIFTCLLFIVNHITVFGLFVHHQVYRLLWWRNLLLCYRLPINQTCACQQHDNEHNQAESEVSAQENGTTL
jgi:hypothetical protein